MKKLYRSKDNKIIAGVLGGIAEYLEIDPVVVRIVFVLLTCITGFFPGLVFYFIALFIVPNKIDTVGEVPKKEESVAPETSAEPGAPIQE